MLPSRRDVLKAGAAGGAALTLGGLSRNVLDALAAPPQCGSLKDIEHVVIFIQENRSFDHYFGTFPGVTGFGSAPASVLAQPDPNPKHPYGSTILPYHLQPRDQGLAQAYCTSDITHSWAPQHQSWDGGKMDGFVAAHYAEDPKQYPLTMGYYEQADIPFFWAVAQAFTLCDHYHCSVIGPTDPNRLYAMTATVDPDGAGGGPLVETLSADRPKHAFSFRWKTMPEVLEAHGISWKVYGTPDANAGDNVLAYFAAYKDPTLAAKAFGPTFPGDFEADCAAGMLPQVSWVLAPLVATEHPPAPPSLGEQTLLDALTALTGNPAVWSKTALFYTYDENGGFFDHVVPPTAPAGTPGEYIPADVTPVNGTDLGGYRGPIGLGFRVPMIVISPFSKGGFVASDTYDHTSTLKFLERRFGVPVPNLSAWRRRTVGDLTSAFNFSAPDFSQPAYGASPVASDENLLKGAPICLVNSPSAGGGPALFEFPPPDPQVAPVQQRGVARRPSGPCGAVEAATATPTGPGLPSTGEPNSRFEPPVPASLALTALAVVGALALRLRRRGEIKR